FDVERQLGHNWLVDIVYTGNKGTRLVSGAFNANQVDSKYLTLGNLLIKPINDPAVVAAGFTPPYPGFQGSLAQDLRPFPQYTYVGTVDSLNVGVTTGSANIGNSTYESLRVKAQHRFSSGLYVLATYTWAKSLTDSSSTFGGFFSGGARD